MKNGVDLGSLIPWPKINLGMPPDAEFSISDERSKELLAQIAKGDKDRPFMELVSAYGKEMRGIFAARVKDAGEMEEVENEFWIKVVQIAGNHDGKAPVKRWLSVIAKRLAIAADRRMDRRSQLVAYQAEIAAKMRDDGEEDDLDLEMLADKDAVAEIRSIQPDEAMEQEERKEAVRRLMRYLGRSKDRKTQLIRRRYIESASYEQMTAEEHTTVSNMHTLVSRAIASRRQALLEVYRGGDLEYARKQSKKPK